MNEELKDAIRQFTLREKGIDWARCLRTDHPSTGILETKESFMLAMQNQTSKHQKITIYEISVGGGQISFATWRDMETRIF
ncbi:hypothetical protein P4E94_14245 [Pontiellaceae bacterium B12219]|nr:hypothetical protein [Pontiellaceae bacterium B12219]